MSDAKGFIDVAAGLILTEDGQLLLAQRPGDKAWSGWWELPGGKLEPGETTTEALVRELKEELGISVTHSTPWVTYTHEYPKTIVRLAFHRVTGWKGKPWGIEGQALAWTPIHGPASVSPLLPATKPPLRWLQLPDRYLLTSIGTPDGLKPFLKKLDAALEAGVRLVQFREPAWAQQRPDQNRDDPEGDRKGGDAEGSNLDGRNSKGGDRERATLYDAFQQVLNRCRQHGAWCIVNSVHPVQWAEQADGIHYRAADARKAADAKGAKGVADVADIADVINAADSAALSRSHSPETDADRLGSTDDNDKQSDIASRFPGALRGDRYVGMSAHSEQGLQLARHIQADFVVLGHVLDTPSHPGVPGMGWARFIELNQQAGLPAFAIGGQSSKTADDAARAGAHGIAGIRLIDDSQPE